MAVAQRDIDRAGHVIAPAQGRQADRLRGQLTAHGQAQAPRADRRERGGQARLGTRTVQAGEVHAGDLDARQDASFVGDRQADQEGGGRHEGQDQAQERPAEQAADPAARPDDRRRTLVAGARIGQAQAGDRGLEAGCGHGFTAGGA